MKLLDCQDIMEWRQWLRANHRKTDSIWLVYYKKGTGSPASDAKTDLTYEKSVEEALCSGWIDSIIKKIDEKRYARKFTPRKPGSKWSQSNKQRIEKLLAAGRLKAAGQRLVDQAKADGSWDAPAAPLTPDQIPRELSLMLKKSKSAQKRFNDLPPSQRKQFMQWIAAAKKTETRQRRSQKTIEMIKEGKSPFSL